MVDEEERFDGKSRGNVSVVDLKEIVAIGLFAASGEIGGSAVNDGIGAVQTTDNEFVMNFVARRRGDLVEGRGQGHGTGFAGDEHALFGTGLIQEGASRGIGNSIAVKLWCAVDLF